MTVGAGFQRRPWPSGHPHGARGDPGRLGILTLPIVPLAVWEYCREGGTISRNIAGIELEYSGDAAGMLQGCCRNVAGMPQECGTWRRREPGAGGDPGRLGVLTAPGATLAAWEVAGEFSMSTTVTQAVWEYWREGAHDQQEYSWNIAGI